MKRLLDYIAESEFADKRPVPGDVVGISVSTDIVVETVVTEITESGDFYIETTDKNVAALIKAGVIAEDFTQLLPHNQQQHKTEPTDGHMSPINGNAFKPYDRDENPRTWFKRDVKRKNEPEDDGLEDAIKGLRESKIYLRTQAGTVETTLGGDLVKKAGSHQWFCKAW